MKKFLVIFLTILVLVSLTACSGGNNEDTARIKMQEYCKEQKQTLLWIDETEGVTTEGLSFKYIALLENNYNADMELWLLNEDGKMVSINFFRR